jgi:hypothetical protein
VVGDPGFDRDGVSLAAQSQPTDQGLVAVNVFVTEVIKKPAAFRHHADQATAGVEVLPVGAEVIGHLLNPFGKYGDL